MKNKKYVISKTKTAAYPYTVDEVEIKVATNYPDAVYIQDKSGNKYAVNGNAHVYFTQIKKDRKYKGYSSLIYNELKSDLFVLITGRKIYRERQRAKRLHLFLMLPALLAIGVILYFFFFVPICDVPEWLFRVFYLMGLAWLL